MKIAVIGGGASGMIAAYLLDQQGHHVTVYERQSVLGGHIRTLNQNVFSPTACQDNLEMGVLEFPVEFTHFLQLMRELDIPLEPVAVGSGLFFQDGRHFLSPVMIDRNFHGLKKWKELLHVEGLYARSLGLWLKTRARVDRLHDQPLATYLLPENARTIWIKLLTMYSYSMPYETINNFPADLAIPALRRYVFSHWVRIKGGVYSYIEKIRSRLSGDVILNANITEIHRNDDRVQISGAMGNGLSFYEQFDRVIFATPPDQVLKLLSDPRPDEVRCFQAWKPNIVSTTLHCDRTLYSPYGIQQASEFDFFQTNESWGYNAALNQLCGITSDQSYYLAFQLQERIAPDKIIHTQEHHTPFYDVASLQYRDKVIAMNGRYQTYYAGAYLGDGLHEGAVVSAMRVAYIIDQEIYRPSYSPSFAKI